MGPLKADYRFLKFVQFLWCGARRPLPSGNAVAIKGVYLVCSVVWMLSGFNVLSLLHFFQCVSVHVFLSVCLCLPFRFSVEFSILMEFRSSQWEESSVVTLLNAQHHIHLQLRLGPHSLTFISTQHREYEYDPGP